MEAHMEKKSPNAMKRWLNTFFSSYTWTPNMMLANYREFGDSLDVLTFGDFVSQAKELYRQGMSSIGDLSNYTVVDLGLERVGIDYRGNIRGIFTKKGTPLAYFRPDFRQSGFYTKDQELHAFRLSGKPFSEHMDNLTDPEAVEKPKSPLATPLPQGEQGEYADEAFMWKNRNAGSLGNLPSDF